jgi:hypothetical protein
LIEEYLPFQAVRHFGTSGCSKTAMMVGTDSEGVGTPSVVQAPRPEHHQGCWNPEEDPELLLIFPKV